MNPNQQENLMQTQVLNLNDVEETVNYENKTSKRPAIMLAIAGLFAIVVGIAYPYIMSAIDGEEEVVTKKETTTNTSTLTCTITTPANADGTDTITTINFNLEDDKLQNYTKVLEVTPTAGNATGSVTIQTLLTNYKALEATTIDGYVISTSQTATGIKSTLNIDLTKLDVTRLTDIHKGNTFTNVEYALNTDSTTLSTNLTSAGYTCS